MCVFFLAAFGPLMNTPTRRRHVPHVSDRHDWQATTHQFCVEEGLQLHRSRAGVNLGAARNVSRGDHDKPLFAKVRCYSFHLWQATYPTPVGPVRWGGGRTRTLYYEGRHAFRLNIVAIR